MVRSWAFLRRPFWLFSHVFVGSMIVFCVWAMIWQLGRLDERRELNATVAERLDQAPIDASTLASAAASMPEDLEFVPVELTGTYLEPSVVRVVNRSSNGVPVEWVVARFAAVDGPVVVVNRGFVPAADASPAAPDGTVTLTGWVRLDEEKSLFGVGDDGVSPQMPLLVAEAANARADDGTDVVSGVWVQRATSTPTDEAAVAPVPLPTPDEGPHRSYAVQWAIFGTLTAIFYAAILRRRARDDGRDETISDA